MSLCTDIAVLFYSKTNISYISTLTNCSCAIILFICVSFFTFQITNANSKLTHPRTTAETFIFYLFNCLSLIYGHLGGGVGGGWL